jgi:D-inositol-3-phosphate glycosyltransferase
MPFDGIKLFDFIPEFITRLEKYIREQKIKYDLVYSHYWLSGLAGEWLKTQFVLPLVHTFHTLAVFKEEALGREEQNIRHMAESHLTQSADRIISSSLQEKKCLVEGFGLPPEKVEVIYPGVNSRVFYPVEDSPVVHEYKQNPDDLLLLYVGRIDPVKGLMSALEAMAGLRQKDASQFGRVKLLIIGGGDRHRDLSRNTEVQNLKKYCREKRLQSKVVFLGSVKQTRLKDYYTAADALIVPSFYESFGLVVVEALAAGTPVLVSDVGEMDAFVKEGKNGFIFRSNNPSSLLEALISFGRKRRNLWDGQRIRKDIIGKISWKKTADRIRLVFEELLKK